MKPNAVLVIEPRSVTIAMAQAITSGVASARIAMVADSSARKTYVIYPSEGRTLSLALLIVL